MYNLYNLWCLNINLVYDNSFYDFEHPPHYMKKVRKYHEFMKGQKHDTKDIIWKSLLDKENHTSANLKTSIHPKIFWLPEFLLFIPNIIFLPILYTIFDIFTRKPLNDEERQSLKTNLQELKNNSPEIFDTIVHGLYYQDIFQSFNSKVLSCELLYTHFEYKHDYLPEKLASYYEQYEQTDLTIPEFLKEFEFCCSIVRAKDFMINLDSNNAQDKSAYSVYSDSDQMDNLNSINTNNIKDKKDKYEEAFAYMKMFHDSKDIQLKITIDDLRRTFQGYNKITGRTVRPFDDTVSCSAISMMAFESEQKHQERRNEQYKILEAYLDNPLNNGTNVMQYLHVNASKTIYDLNINQGPSSQQLGSESEIENHKSLGRVLNLKLLIEQICRFINSFCSSLNQPLISI